MTAQLLIQKPVVVDDATFTAAHFQEIASEASKIFQETGNPDCSLNWLLALRAIRWRHFSMDDWRAEFEWENSFGQRKEEYYSRQ
ncbi:hypothetical protein A2X44_01665 [candidate division CPR3 bacterium GWF2_35_18]|uniref:Uncharacterized protein n=1 Tax=candidate division CPR3 bacterium GW2011_GWF2_35_18 TaxID=1618350 RepID=A0A0G0ERF1_UNCC3|nr:MAG: hypothetical protein UR67_C0002G0017 [candidate division CPR3 bacterium GW2011_GWF2_35_18]OGB62708.1 MAG: hypothetical protein A2X44_01665 [candidate division CPR3 bacterium GWF2_35_18]OGB65734.1 MAG: hypothetical protein A2250_01925 [candidate division CPR3 bacterium RIFOXYA2_FULL_35_13]OGB78792.1 MAG: hypothetical protein A2296_02535 [candidate division CPR3 bacterium RIFOXYB2_FULL_35_8]